MAYLAPMRRVVLAIAATAAATGACKKQTPAPVPEPTPVTPSAPPDDPHSAARPHETAVTHLALDLTVDFDARRLHGTARYTLDRKVAGAPLVLDTRDLAIVATRTCEGAPVPHTLGAIDPLLGAPLTIELPAGATCAAVEYHTAPDAAALLWVAPAGTLGGKHPMLFTQSQPIDGRTWLPSQDSPGVRFTYEATVRVPPGLLALMSAENPQAVTADGVYRFRMTQPVPSYLVALAAGDLAFRPLGARTGVYAEPALVDAAASELAEVDAMMTTAEELYGPYRWGRYDLLVLPPSFPMGGMENPRLTFLTPTIITGDRTLVSLIAHELAHSWSGNLVTNATWNGVWLNEGFTTYVERRIMEKLRGPEVVELLWQLGRGDLDAEVVRFGATSPRTRLDQSLDATHDPDGAMSEIAYEKGALFLRALERRLGRDRFDGFLRARFDRLAFQSSDTATFAADLQRAFGPEHDGFVATWLTGTGVPDGAPGGDSTLAGAIGDAAREFAASGRPVDARSWKSLEWIAFLRSLPPTITIERLRELDRAHQLTASPNAVLLSHWLPLLIARDERAALPTIDRFATTIGRRILVRPVYAAMATAGGFWLDHARALFAQAGPSYHPITRNTIAEILAAPKIPAP